MPSSIHDLLQLAVDGISTVLHTHTVALLIVAIYILFNVLMYATTKGKEFCWAGYTGALFLIPFIKFH